RQICKADGCGKELRRDNKTGLCPAHHYFTELHPSGKVCSEPRCGKQLKINNKSGFCPDHRWLNSRKSIEVRLCGLPDCRRELRSDNKTGFCREHTHLSYVLPPRTYEAEGCPNMIGHNSKSGLCHTHFAQRYANENREAAKRRTAGYRLRLQAKLDAAWRPDDWNDKAVDYQIVGQLLLDVEMNNKELAAKLDKSKLLTCPYAPTWNEAAEARDNRAFLVYINRIRGWVRRPYK